jgi:hypothetical protein
MDDNELRIKRRLETLEGIEESIRSDQIYTVPNYLGQNFLWLANSKEEFGRLANPRYVMGKSISSGRRVFFEGDYWRIYCDLMGAVPEIKEGPNSPYLVVPAANFGPEVEFRFGWGEDAVQSLKRYSLERVEREPTISRERLVELGRSGGRHLADFEDPLGSFSERES